MITFNRLWETMQKKNVTQYKLITNYGVSRGQLTRFLIVALKKSASICLLTSYNQKDVKNRIGQTVSVQLDFVHKQVIRGALQFVHNGHELFQSDRFFASFYI